MKNRLLNVGRSLLGAVCVLSVCVVTYSCSDDYDLPDTKPGFLGGSIYDELKERGNFKTVVRLIDDLEYAEVLSKTGSKTLFVAPDSVFDAFFAATKWVGADSTKVECYEDLTLSQKKLLLNGTMLNNAYVIEMMSNTAGGGKNLCLRQPTAASVLDSIPYFTPNELPELRNPNDLNYWKRFKDGSYKGIYMALDRTNTYMAHFLEGYMRNSGVKKSDVAVVLNLRNTPKDWKDTDGDRSYIFNREVIEQDVTCLNGYFNVLDGVLLQPQNMAEEIRISGVTNHFSHMLDRFSAPFYSEELTREYKALHDIGNDSVYEKRYFAERSQNGNKLSTDPNKEAIANYPFLSYDPGWNLLSVSSTVPVENDMAAMFVPNDEAMLRFFQEGVGKQLMERYAKVKDTGILNHGNLDTYTDSIPLNIVRALVNNLMKTSFSGSVPSKFRSIMNDARDPMFSTYRDLEDYKNLIDSCILANNGVVYIINNVISPADYSAVSAPVLTSGKAEVVNKVITVDEGYINANNFTNAPLMQYFGTYLKSMQSSFSFFVPTDSALDAYGYADPARYCTGMPAALGYEEKMKFIVDNVTQNAVFPIEMRAFKYDYEEDKLGKRHAARNNGANTGKGQLESGLGKLKASLIVEMINQHIVVHENNDMDGVRSGRMFYESRGGAPVIVYDNGVAAGNAKGMEVGGGFQHLANTSDDYKDQKCKVIDVYNQLRESSDVNGNGNGYGNGMTYFLDRPMEPTFQSVYRVMDKNKEFSKFFELITGKLDPDVLEKMGLRLEIEADGDMVEMNETDWAAECLKYQIMVDNVDNAAIFPATGEKLVRMFNNYRYTIYVPTNEKLEDAIDNKGLPTWSSITTFVEDPNNQVEGELTDSAKTVANAMLMQLLNTLRYHFQDKAIYVDNVDSDVTGDTLFQTSSLDEVNEVYRSVKVEQKPGQLFVNGTPVTQKNNLLARDINFDANFSALSLAGYSIATSSSYVVLHQIDDILDFKTLGVVADDKRYEDEWNTEAKAKAYLAKYKISK